jgi:ubiquinone/menaquinone biosynthesis C-methylase UbiE
MAATKAKEPQLHMPSDFKDHFSTQAELYAQYRPQYPDELYVALAALTNQHILAWDCGTGNGQAATSLAIYYQQVVATDPSAQQISHCMPDSRISYRVERAEHSSLEDASVDLLTIANALHWFDHDAFYAEANRVLKRGGVIAAWCYGNPVVDAATDQIITRYHDEIVGAYWLPESRIVENEYRDLYFPFIGVAMPDFYCERDMSRGDLIGLLLTWSATQRFIDANGYDPLETIEQELAAIWPDEERRKARWKLTLRVGRSTR